MILTKGTQEERKMKIREFNEKMETAFGNTRTFYNGSFHNLIDMPSHLCCDDESDVSFDIYIASTGSMYVTMYNDCCDVTVALKDHENTNVFGGKKDAEMLYIFESKEKFEKVKETFLNLIDYK